MVKVERKEYLDQLISLRDKHIIKIITGVRRSGKSTLMEMFQEYLINQGVNKDNIIAINFEDYEHYDLRNPNLLYQYIMQRLVSNSMNYIFFDEIQHVENFASIVDSLFIKNNVDLYLTGSNAYMLSSEIATFISGRYIEISILPLSFAEYVSTTGDKKDLARKYTDYVQNSSFPYTLELRDNHRAIMDYLDGIYNTVVVKDITTRKKITDTSMLESVVRFMFDNIGNTLSMKKIADTMTSDGRKIDVKAVEKYVEALLESYVLYKANRFNIKGKQLLKTLEKYYVVDIGMRYMLLGTSATDIGHILENVVYLELLRRGYEVYVGKVDELEVDFVAVNEKGRTYYQVAASVRDENTFKREIKSLEKIDDHYAKYILTLDEDMEADYNGIRRINVLDWLLDK